MNDIRDKVLSGGRLQGPIRRMLRTSSNTKAGLTRTIRLWMMSQRWGRMGRMDGGSRSPSTMWMIPLDAMMLALSTGIPLSPKRIVPCGKKEPPQPQGKEEGRTEGRRQRLTLSETETDTI